MRRPHRPYPLALHPMIDNTRFFHHLSLNSRQTPSANVVSLPEGTTPSKLTLIDELPVNYRMQSDRKGRNGNMTAFETTRKRFSWQ